VTGGKTPLRNALTLEEREEEERLNRAITEANNEIRSAHGLAQFSRPAEDELARRRDAARMSYSAFNDVMWSSHSELQSMGMGAQPFYLDRFTNAVQDDRTAFLEYVVTADTTQLFVLNRGASGYDLRSYKINIKQEALVDKVNEFHRMMSDRRPSYAARSRELFDLLVGPAVGALRGRKTLCIVPDGPLWEVPFHSLQSDRGRCLLQDYVVYYVPSLSVLERLSLGQVRDPQLPSLLAFGNPFVGAEAAPSLEARRFSDLLPDAEREVDTLGRIVGSGRSRIVVGTNANEKAFKSLASQYGTLHFATHGVLDNRNPLYSFLVLARRYGETEEDGLLEAREVMNMDLRADLAVLSSCETARGKIGAGEGVIGMSWAFFAAGCRTTLVSQWKVDSASTSALMIKFYQYLQPSSTKVRRTKAEALRLASLDLMKDERYRHPFYWAPFVLVGAN
jgi:CHAT domain-containing protein